MPGTYFEQMKLLFEDSQCWCLRILPRPKVWAWNVRASDVFSLTSTDAGSSSTWQHNPPRSIMFYQNIGKNQYFSQIPEGKIFTWEDKATHSHQMIITPNRDTQKTRISIIRIFLPTFINGSLSVQTWELAQNTLVFLRAQSIKNSIWVAKFLSD